MGEVLTGKDIGDQDGDNYIYNSIGQLIENKEEGIEYVYNASGLVTEIKKNTVTLVKFYYNDKGHRVRKDSWVTGSLKTDYYIRDVAGTALAIYSGTTVKEHTIYGASRLGVYNKADGSSYYQLTDHLGNVRAVTGRASNGTPLAIVSATDYYPFGMPMPNRNIEGGYRYGYQGEFAEKEGEMPGVNSFELRLWDSRIGRWLTTDPMGEFHSPYLGMGNNPISKIDPSGGSTEDPPTEHTFGDGHIWSDADGTWAWNAELSVWKAQGNTSTSFLGNVQQLDAVTIITQKSKNDIIVQSMINHIHADIAFQNDPTRKNFLNKTIVLPDNVVRTYDPRKSMGFNRTVGNVSFDSNYNVISTQEMTIPNGQYGFHYTTGNQFADSDWDADYNSGILTTNQDTFKNFEDIIYFRNTSKGGQYKGTIGAIMFKTHKDKHNFVKYFKNLKNK